MTTRQFAGQYKPRIFFDRKVQNTGYTRTLSMGKIIPKDWKYVRLTVLESQPSYVIVRIDKLLGDINYARISAANKRSEQHT